MPFGLLTAAIAIGGLLACEAYLRGDRVMDLPLEALLTHRNDTHTRAVWLLRGHAGAASPAATGGRPVDVLILGNSTAFAVVELPWRDASGANAVPVPRGASGLLNLSASAACHAEHTVLAETALASGLRPRLSVVFTWPACATDDGGEDLDSALYAERMPLVSQWLMDATAPRSLDDRLQRWWAAHAAIGRYRHFVNAWLHSRFDKLARGQPGLLQPFQPPDRSQPWGRPWSAQTPGMAGIDALSGTLRAALPDTLPGAPRNSGGGLAQLELLVGKLRENGSEVLLIEAPWSPPLRERLAGMRTQYRAALEALAARHGASYLDPNDELALGDGDFNDLFHVTNAAGRRYYAPIARAIEERLR